MAANTRRTARRKATDPWAEGSKRENLRLRAGTALHRAHWQGTRSPAGDFRGAPNAHRAFASVNDEVCQCGQTYRPSAPEAVRTARVRSAI
jgi:hypothetical protein